MGKETVLVQGVAGLHHLAHQRHDRQRGVPHAAGGRGQRGGHRQGAQARPQPSHGPVRDGGPRRASTRAWPCWSSCTRAWARSTGPRRCSCSTSRRAGWARKVGRGVYDYGEARRRCALPAASDARRGRAAWPPSPSPARRCATPSTPRRWTEFHRALDEVRRARCTVLIITGAGDKAFVSGADINAIRAAAPRRRAGLHQLAPDVRGGGRTRRSRSRPSTATPWAAAASWRWPATCASPPRAPSSACPSPRWASSPARAARSACPASSASGRAKEMILTGARWDAAPGAGRRAW